MQLIRGIHNIQPVIDSNSPNTKTGCVLTIGNFDGVHLGHRRVIAALVDKARTMGVEAAVMVFEPQPQELFSPKTAPARLTRLRDKYVLLKKLGVDKLICVNFNRKFSSLTAQTFIEDLMVEKLAIKHLIIGDDFRFGKNRVGNFDMLHESGKVFDFGVSDTKSFKLSDCRISSTEIRHALENDDLAKAEKMLGRPYSIIGRVFHGDKRGRTIGFPTANVKLKRRVSPVSGVYVVQVNIDNDKVFGVANIGSRPTVAGVRQQLEVHIFDFNRNIYGEIIEVVLLKKLRKEMKFSDVTELTAQIEKDSLQAQRYLNEQLL